MFILNESFHIDYLRMRVQWIRNMNKQATFTFDRIRLPYTLIWLVLDEKLLVEINGEQRWAVQGDLIMCPPNTQFGLIPRNSEERIHYLSLCADLKIGNMDLVSLYGLPSLAKMGASEELTRWIYEWKTLVEEFDKFGDLINMKASQQESEGKNTYFLHTDVPIHYCGLQGLIYRWVQQWMTKMRSMLPNEPLRFDHRVMQVCDYVRERLDQPLRLQELADHAHISVSQLSHLFMETLGTAPMEFVRRSRIDLAKQMLMNHSLSLREIAEKIGFEEQGQLSRAFKRAEGISPSQYRNKSNNFPN